MKISLDEESNVNLGETAVDGNQNQSDFQRNQSAKAIYKVHMVIDEHSVCLVKINLQSG